MKKVAFIMVGLLTVMLAGGCSDGSSSSGASAGGSSSGSSDTTTTYSYDGKEAEGVRGLSSFPPVPAIPE